MSQTERWYKIRHWFQAGRCLTPDELQRELEVSLVTLKRDIQHLNLDDARSLIERIRPRLAILTHFGMTMHRARPWELAQKLSEETGLEVRAASDGAKFDL